MSNSIGELVRHHRKQNYLTQKQLAARLGVSQRTVGRWEANEREPLRIIDWLRLIEEIPEVRTFAPPSLGFITAAIGNAIDHHRPQ
jgi:transcriptional regulator with XRE-family HTH domain